MKNVLIVAGGQAVSSDALVGLPTGVFVIAADGGLAHARALGLRVDEAVGDFDSASSEDLAWARTQGARIEEHPAVKDATDLELALHSALAQGPQRIVVLGGHGGRFDHWLANVLLLAAPEFADVEITARMGSNLITIIRDTAALAGNPGDIVSLLPTHGAAHGVRTSGLAYPLRGETLPAGTTRGVSNVFVDSAATVSLDDGVLVVVQPL